MIATFVFPFPLMTITKNLPSPVLSWYDSLTLLTHFPRMIEHVPPGWYHVLDWHVEDEQLMRMCLHVFLTCALTSPCVTGSRHAVFASGNNRQSISAPSALVHMSSICS